MGKPTKRPQRSDKFARKISLGVTLLAVVTTAGCEGLLDVDIPGRVPATALDNPLLANTLVLGAQADFECGWSEYILAESLFTDEYIVASSIVSVTMTDARSGQYQGQGGGSCTTARNRRSTSPYRPVQLARYQAEDNYTRITGFEGIANKEAHLARLALYAGYSYVLLGEGYCDLTTAVDGGVRRSKVSLWQAAEAWFAKSIGHAQSAGLTDVRLAATLGRARARLDLGGSKLAEAVTDAQAIPENFTYNVIRDATVPSRDNIIYQQSGLNPHHAVDPLFRGLTISAQGNATQNDGVADPRVPVRDGGHFAEDGFTPMWYQMKYTKLTDPFPLATWREAQLIIAEIQQGQAAVAIINKLRDKWGLPHFASIDPVAIKNAVIEEKRRETFSEGHRISEMQRHDLPWQQGVNHRGLTYGTFECFPEFFSERDNTPNFCPQSRRGSVCCLAAPFPGRCPRWDARAERGSPDQRRSHQNAHARSPIVLGAATGALRPGDVQGNPLRSLSAPQAAPWHELR